VLSGFICPLRCILRAILGYSRHEYCTKRYQYQSIEFGYSNGEKARHHSFNVSPKPQVIRVSTVRRSSAKNSADCISFRREAVRGNSCDSGPSV
jgi:hypothetical protein